MLGIRQVAAMAATISCKMVFGVAPANDAIGASYVDYVGNNESLLNRP